MSNYTLMSLGALMILSIAIIGINRHLLETSRVVAGSEYVGTAATLGQQIIEEANQKYYDEALIGALPKNLPSQFTGNMSLGPESGESYPNYDDVDDYNGYTRTENTPRAQYQILVSVTYVDSTDWNTAAGLPTFFKRLRVTVNSSYLPAPVILETLYAYYRRTKG